DPCAIVRARPPRPAPGVDRAGLRAPGGRLGADLLRRDARHLHGQRLRVRTALDGGAGERLADRRVRHAPRVHGDAQGTARRARRCGRSHHRDPAPHRSGAARRRGPFGARRAHHPHRLRRPPSGWRYAVRVDHRRLRGAGARRRAPAGRRRSDTQPAHRHGGRRVLWRGRRDAAARPRLSRGLLRRSRRQRGDDRRRRTGGGPGDGRAHAALARPPRRTAAPRRGGHHGAALRAGRGGGM
ncbi:MAG: Ribonuclease PH, partial [uncultured Solirubrobacteraceae bacterium]